MKEVEDWLAGFHGVAREDAVKVSLQTRGSPGLAWKMLFDEKLKGKIADAKKFLHVRPEERKDFLKKLLEDEMFSLPIFLDALVLSTCGEGDIYGKFWHAMLELRGAADGTPLNPRIQLSELWNKT